MRGVGAVENCLLLTVFSPQTQEAWPQVAIQHSSWWIQAGHYLRLFFLHQSIHTEEVTSKIAIRRAWVQPLLCSHWCWSLVPISTAQNSCPTHALSMETMPAAETLIKAEPFGFCFTSPFAVPICDPKHPAVWYFFLILIFQLLHQVCQKSHCVLRLQATAMACLECEDFLLVFPSESPVYWS